MNHQAKLPSMTGERSLFTEREREILAGKGGVKDNYRYKVESTARQRVRRIEADVEVLREHHPEIYEMLRTRVCEEKNSE